MTNLNKETKARLRELGIDAEGKTAEQIEGIFKRAGKDGLSYEARKRLAILESGGAEALLREVLKNPKKPKPERKKPGRRGDLTPLQRSRRRMKEW